MPAFRRLVPALWLLAAAPAGAASPEGVPPPGATACTGCHPASATGPVPGLNGRPADEVVAQMIAFRAGERASTVMGRIAKGFTDDEIRAVADWFADHAAAKP